MENTAHRAIAIVGVGAILPDAPNAPAFWNNVKTGRYSISDVPTNRWDPAWYFDSDPSAPDKTYSKIGGWVREYVWDPMNWRLPIPPRVADGMDIAQQWAVACTREALEDYGYPKRPLDFDRTAVILGNAMAGEKHYLSSLRIFFPEYAHELEASPSFASLPPAMQGDIKREFHDRMADRVAAITEDTMPGELANCMAGRIANLYNFHGPNYVCDAACASAMAAIKSAVEGLIENDFDAAVTGGIDRNMGAPTFVKFCKIGALSATGTRPFAEGADGFVMGEGAAIFLMKRLADAERDQDTIYAVVRGIGGSSDGKGKGITAPNPVGQKFCVERAWKNAGLSPATGTLIEGHGTSTRVGDVVEAESMAAVLRSSSLPVHSVALGSVKSNIGHLKGAAGAAGILKAAFALRDKLLPPSLHCERPSADIDFAHSPLYVNTELKPWEISPDGVRRAGASAFGFGGTNFHVVMEEHIPGRLNGNGKHSISVPTMQPQVMKDVSMPASSRSSSVPAPASSSKAPLRGALVVGAASAAELAERLRAVQKAVAAGKAPAPAVPAASDLHAAERVAIDYADASDLATRAAIALKALDAGQDAFWKAVRAQGIFRGSGPAPKVAFLYTGQGSQYVNMLRTFRDSEPIVAATFAEADRVMTPMLGKPLTGYIFVDSNDPTAVAKAEEDLRQTEITQPAVLAIDIGLTRLLAAYGIEPDMTMGHSLGEYCALVASGAISFENALEAVSARGRGMTRVAVADKGRMAAVFAPVTEVERILRSVNGYVVIANVNSNTQSVIGGGTAAVEQAIRLFLQAGYNVVEVPVSHAFHTSIVAPASEPLRQMLERLNLQSPRIPNVANFNGEFYPSGPGVVPKMLDLLAQQVASPVQFVKGLHTLYDAGARVFVEVGPKKALQGFAEDVLGNQRDVVALFTNHPKLGDIAAFNQALCGLYAAGLGRGEAEMTREVSARPFTLVSAVSSPADTGESTSKLPVTIAAGPAPSNGNRYVELGHWFAEVLERGWEIYGGKKPAFDMEPIGITGAALGLPGTEHIFDNENVARILRGDQLIDAVPEPLRRAMLDKHVTRLVKSANGTPTFETITDVADVVKLAGRGGAFDLEAEFGVSAERLSALDRTTCLAIAVGLEAMRDAGIPLVMRYKTTTLGTQLPDRWGLPDALRDDTGVIFASAFPGYDAFAEYISGYHVNRGRREQLELLTDLRGQLKNGTGHSTVTQELDRRIGELRGILEKEPYVFDRRFLFRTLSMGHSQFAELIGARGPNTQINAACASTSQAVTLAEDWIRAGRCHRVIIISADDVTSDHLMEWFGSGFLASGAAATDEVVEDAAIPFDRRRHGLIVGMGAAALVVESAEAARERGIRPICEVLSAVTANSAFHGSRLDVQHIGDVMEKVIAQAEARSGISRYEIAPQTVFVSHETYTPARGGSASAEIFALRRVFGQAADQIVIANTKGMTGHAMATGIEEVVAVKALETGCVPPVANFKEIDPELGALNLSKGGAYPIQYALRLGAGFGSQISMALLRWVTTPDGVHRTPNELGYAYRIADTSVWNGWLSRIADFPTADLEVVHRTLRLRDQGSHAHPAVAGDESRTAAAPTPKPPAPSGPPSPAVEGAAKPVFQEREAAKPAEAAPVATRPSEPTMQPTAENHSVKDRILALAVDKTGYPADMLDLDLDLEADLGVDTVKQAEMFAAIREMYNIPRDENRKLRDYPTLARVIRFVYEKRPDLAESAASPSSLGAAPAESTAVMAIAEAGPAATVRSSPAIAAATPAAEAQATFPTVSVEDRILELMVEKTGYPKDMLDLDLDLEADLGVDTVKQAEMFAAIREIYNIPRDENRKLRDYPTLAHVIRFVYENRPDLAVDASSSATSNLVESVVEPVSVVPSPAAAPVVPDESYDSIKQKILQIVAEKTGYPPDMLDLDLDLEADLGVDTVKQAEMFAAVRAAYNIPRDETLKLRDFPTLAHVIQFAHERRPGTTMAVTVSASKDANKAEEPPVAPSMPAPVRTPRPAPASFDAANRVPRRVPVPTLRPPLALCKPTGVALGSGSRVVLMPDRSGIADALSQQLQLLGVAVLRIDPALDADALAGSLKQWLADGPVQGVYWLAALDDEGPVSGMDLGTWHEALRIRVKSLYTTMRILYGQVAAPGTFLVSATRLGGQHGYDEAGAIAPMGGAVTGFIKAYKRERTDALVKAVDFESGGAASEIANRLIEETLRDPGAVEIGYQGGLRSTIALQEQPAADGHPGLTLDENTVFVITGAAGSIVSAITADLAAASSGTFYLIDLVPQPDANSADLKRFASDKDGLKRDLFTRIQSRGERATPALVEKELATLERAQAALTAIEAVRSAGGTAHYFSVDLADPEGVSKVIEHVRQHSGRIDVLLHAAGVERSHFLPEKDRREFDLVFDVKVDGWFNLLRAIGDMPLGATVAFSSIAGRFGNAGQTDYSAANDLLCKFTSSFRTTRPLTRGMVIDWTAWGGIGMATRGSIPKMMEVAGIDMLPPEAGVPLIRRELTAGGTRGEVVIANRLGALLNEWDATGGLDTAALAASSEQREANGPMVGKITGMGLHSGLTIETTLDPATQPFLYDHRIDGTPVLPGVMGIEAFAEAAICLYPGWHIEAVEEMNFLAPFKFYRDQPRTLTIHGSFYPQNGKVIASCRLTGRRTLPNQPEPQETTHFTARVRMSEEPLDVATGAVPRISAEAMVQAAQIYRMYFHGPAYQVLERAWWDGTRMVGEMAVGLPSNHQPSDRPTLTSPRLIELCFQTAGLWEMAAHHRMGLPQHVHRVSCFRAPQLGEGPLYAVVTPHPDQGTCDAEVVDAHGNRYLSLSGYRTSALAGGLELESLQALQAVISPTAVTA